MRRYINGKEEITYFKHEVQVLRILDLMDHCNFQTDSYTYVCLLQGCVNRGAFDEGKIIHSHIVKTGSKHNVFLWTTLTDMYAKCGIMEEASRVFDGMPEHNLVSWNVMIAGYVKHGLMKEASRLFKKMMNEGVKPDMVTIMSMIQACAIMKDTEGGRLLHSHALYAGLHLNVLLENALIDMYAKFGSMDDACGVFKKMLRQDMVSWNAMIAGYALSGNPEVSLRLFHDMQQKGMMPDDITFLCTLNACASLGSLEQGREIHLMMVKTRTKLTTDMENAIIDMYGKCGSVESAFQVFSSMCERDNVSWNVMIAGYSQSGSGNQALELLLQMQEGDVKMNQIALVGLLSACRHAGLVDYGCPLFLLMTKSYGVMPVQEHHACMVDLFGRAGHLDEAFEFINRSPCQPSSAAWRALLGACRIHNDVEKAQQATESILDLEPQNDAANILLFNTYTAAGGRGD